MSFLTVEDGAPARMRMMLFEDMGPCMLQRVGASMSTFVFPELDWHVIAQ